MDRWGQSYTPRGRPHYTYGLQIAVDDALSVASTMMLPSELLESESSVFLGRMREKYRRDEAYQVGRSGIMQQAHAHAQVKILQMLRMPHTHSPFFSLDAVKVIDGPAFVALKPYLAKQGCSAADTFGMVLEDVLTLYQVDALVSTSSTELAGNYLFDIAMRYPDELTEAPALGRAPREVKHVFDYMVLRISEKMRELPEQCIRDGMRIH